MTVIPPLSRTMIRAVPWVLGLALTTGTAWASRPAKPRPDSHRPSAEPTEDPPTATVNAPLGGLPPVPDAPPDAEPLGPADAVREAIGTGDLALAQTLLDDEAAWRDAAPDAVALRPALQSLVDAGPPNGAVVGMLLPTEGRYAGVAAMLRTAFEGGLGEALEARVRVVVSDAGETADAAVQALDALCATERPSLVLGPLLTDQADAVAARAEALGVPLLSMTGAVDPSPTGRWAFDGWLSADQQIHALLEHVFTETEARAFAVIAPDNEYGRHAAEVFASGVLARGGTVAEQALYPPDLTDFRAFAAEVVGRDEMPPPPKPRPGEPPSDVKGPPLLRVDAVFVPDSARRVPLVAAGLAHEEFAVGSFEPHDVPPARMLGLSGWNDASLIASGGPYLAGGLFTDVFIPPPPAGYTWKPLAPWPAFVDRQRDVTGRTPRPMEALAWDLGVWTAAIVGSDATRVSVRDALAEGPGPASASGSTDAPTAPEGTPSGPTVTGLSGFSQADRTAQRPIRILSVRADGFAVVLPAPPVDAAPSDEAGDARPPEDP